MSAPFRATYAGRASWGGYMFNCGPDVCLVLRDTAPVRAQLEAAGAIDNIGAEFLFSPVERHGRGTSWFEMLVEAVR